MRVAFADTYYFLALLDSSEQRHLQALEAARDSELRIVTTEWVLTEFGDAYSDPRDRADFIALYRAFGSADGQDCPRRHRFIPPRRGTIRTADG